MDASTILAGGFVHSLHEPDALVREAVALARVFTVGRSATAVALAKRLIWAGSALPEPLEAHLADSLAMLHTSEHDGRECVSAFLQKRAAQFTGRASEAPRIFPLP